MPTAIELHLKATWPVQPDAAKLHGLACALFEGDGADHLGQRKPFGIWPLRAVEEDPSGSPIGWTWRCYWLPDTPPPVTAATAGTLRVGHTWCAVTGISQHRVTHARLAAGPALPSVTVTFTSPTYFSQNGTDVVLPDPRLIAGSWRRQWNASLPDADPLMISEDTWHDASRQLRLASFDLRTQSSDTGYSRQRTGFTGAALLQLDRSASAAARQVLGTLARFAEYCGTGAQTTHGFGATVLSPAGGAGGG